MHIFPTYVSSTRMIIHANFSTRIFSTPILMMLSIFNSRQPSTQLVDRSTKPLSKSRLEALCPIYGSKVCTIGFFWIMFKVFCYKSHTSFAVVNTDNIPLRFRRQSIYVCSDFALFYPYYNLVTDRG